MKNYLIVLDIPKFTNIMAFVCSYKLRDSQFAATFLHKPFDKNLISWHFQLIGKFFEGIKWLNYLGV